MKLTLTYTPLSCITSFIPDVDVLMVDKGHGVKVNESSLKEPLPAECMAAAWGVERKRQIQAQRGRGSSSSRQCLTNGRWMCDDNSRTDFKHESDIR
jgi:hypothetical protein